MKNEVKKKMMIDSRNSPHQSQDERIFSANVNCFLRLVTPNLLSATPTIETTAIDFDLCIAMLVRSRITT
jgi:hypothetical protein